MRPTLVMCESLSTNQLPAHRPSRICVICVRHHVVEVSKPDMAREQALLQPRARSVTRTTLCLRCIDEDIGRRCISANLEKPEILAARPTAPVPQPRFWFLSSFREEEFL